MAVNYEKIYDYLNTKGGKVITASAIAFAIGAERIYGATMAKLVRDGALEKMPADGYYKVCWKM